MAYSMGCQMPGLIGLGDKGYISLREGFPSRTLFSVTGNPQGELQRAVGCQPGTGSRVIIGVRPPC